MPDIFAFGPDRFQTPQAMSQMAAGHCGGHDGRAAQSAAQAVFALAERDVLKIRYNAYRELANAASTSQSRTTRSEVKFVSTVSVAAIQRKADDLAREYRELDTRIQEADWLATLLD